MERTIVDYEEGLFDMYDAAADEALCVHERTMIDTDTLVGYLMKLPEKTTIEWNVPHDIIGEVFKRYSELEKKLGI